MYVDIVMYTNSILYVHVELNEAHKFFGVEFCSREYAVSITNIV